MSASRTFSHAWIGGLLSSIVSPHVSEILLQFALSSKSNAANQFRLSDWESLDKVLTRFVERGVAKRLVIQVLNDHLNLKGNSAVLVESVIARLKGRGLKEHSISTSDVSGTVGPYRSSI